MKFFTAPEHIEPPPNSWDPKTNQTRYLEALRSRNIEIIKGFFRKQEALCKHASCDIRGQYFDLTEKMTDVALGVEMVSDVLRGEVEGLVLITRDVDQVPALKNIQKHKPKTLICLAFPPRRQEFPKALVSCASAHRAFGKFDKKKLAGKGEKLCLGLTPDLLASLRLPVIFTDTTNTPHLIHREPEDWVLPANLKDAGPTVKFIDATLKETIPSAYEQ